MYSPIQDGIDKTAHSVRYTEAKPPSGLAGFVHCFWELKTDTPLPDDFCLHAVPDACVNILFNQIDTKIAGVTALHTTFTVLNLGKAFHYVGIEFFPGVWQGNRDEIANSFVGTPYLGSLPLVEVSNELATQNFAAKRPVLSKLVERLIEQKWVVANVVTAKIMSHIGAIHTVTDMANITHMSARQLQTHPQAGNRIFSTRFSQNIASTTLVQRTLSGALRRPVALYPLVSKNHGLHPRTVCQ